jgi:hypothetical protein
MPPFVLQSTGGNYYLDQGSLCFANFANGPGVVLIHGPPEVPYLFLKGYRRPAVASMFRQIWLRTYPIGYHNVNDYD